MNFKSWLKTSCNQMYYDFEGEIAGAIYKPLLYLFLFNPHITQYIHTCKYYEKYEEISKW